MFDVRAIGQRRGVEPRSDENGIGRRFLGGCVDYRLRPAVGAFERPVDATRPLEPTAAEPTWDLLRTDGVLHRTYWVAQWPRLEVGPAFLGPLLLTTTAVRSFSVVVEPVPPRR